MKYRRHASKSRIPRRVWLLLAVLIALCVGGAAVAHRTYNQNLKPVSASQEVKIVTVEQGSTVKKIAADLEAAGLIRSAWAFELYTHREQLTDKLQAGTYALSPNLGTEKIAGVLTKGKVATRLVTILPGRRIDQVRADFINDGFAPAAVDAALDPKQYADLPVLSYAPQGVATLEGLLWPDSYQRDPTTDPAVIIRQSLIAMGEELTPAIQEGFARQGLTVYQGLILTSVVLQEVNKPVDQAQAAQVFLSRLREGSRLGSDVTAFYGSVAAGRSPSLTYDSPYNTLINTGLPPTPISTINSTSLVAATNPAATDWRYFVAGDDGTTHFSKTFEEHQALIDKYCTTLCGN
jgi:UPF0755 protein